MPAVGLLCAPGLSCSHSTDSEKCIPKFHLFTAKGQTWKHSRLFKPSTWPWASSTSIGRTRLGNQWLHQLWAGANLWAFPKSCGRTCSFWEAGKEMQGGGEGFQQCPSLLSSPTFLIVVLQSYSIFKLGKCSSNFTSASYFLEDSMFSPAFS